jgi:hypothetical protein
VNHWELRGPARDLYDSWRRQGLSEAAAIEEVQRSGILEEQLLGETYEGRGMSAVAARLAAAGRNRMPATGDPFDAMVQLYEARGMSPAAARLAAIGRGRTETEARAAYMELTEPATDDGSAGSEISETTQTQPRTVALQEAPTRPMFWGTGW